MTNLALALTLAFSWLLLRTAPATPAARLLHRCLVDAPARRLAAIRRGSVIAVSLALSLAIAAAALDQEAFRLVAMAAPELGTWAATFEVGTLLDIGIAVLAARSALRWRPLAAWIATRRPGRRRARQARPAPANNPEDDLALAA